MAEAARSEARDRDTVSRDLLALAREARALPDQTDMLKASQKLAASLDGLAARLGDIDWGKDTNR